MRRNVRGRIYVSAIGMSLIVPAMFGVGFAPQTGLLWVAVAFLVLFGIGWGFFDSNNMPILCQVARPELRATGYGIMNLVSISCGGFADVGLRGDARPPRAARRHLFGLRQRRGISIVLVLASSRGTRRAASRGNYKGVRCARSRANLSVFHV
jgi:hypothetical protein